MISYRMDDVIERDMDLLFLEEFIHSQTFLNLFLIPISFCNASVVHVELGKTDENGESDLTVIVEKSGERYGLLIENKIAAKAQPQQAARYVTRGETGKVNGDYAKYSTFIIAPQKYLDANEEAQKYHYQIAYESILATFNAKNDAISSFKRYQIKKAINKQKSGYQSIPDATVTSFWSCYETFQKQHYRTLKIKGSVENKPTNAKWITFRTPCKEFQIVHKTERGYVDLEFPNIGAHYRQLEVLFRATAGNYDRTKIEVTTAGKSAVLRATVTPIDVHLPFDEQQEYVSAALHEVEHLLVLLDSLPLEQVYALYEK